MRSIRDFIRSALAAAASFTYVFIKGVGEEVGRWIRVLQPSAPPAEPPRALEQMVRGDAPASAPTKRGQTDEPVYMAVVELAAALAAGHAPRAAAAQLVDNDTHEWLSLLSLAELSLVSQLPSATLRAHLTGRGRVAALLRMARAEMIERAEDLVRRRLQDEDELTFGERPLLTASM